MDVADHLQIVDESERIWPDNIRIRAVGILLEISRGFSERAIERIQRFEKEFEERYSHRWVADRWADLDRHADAIRQYRIAAQENTTDGWAQSGIGWEALVLGDLEASLEASRRAVELLATEPMPWFNLGVALLANGDGASADDAYLHGLAVAKRLAEPRNLIESAIVGFALQQQFPKADIEAGKKLEAWLKDRLHGL